MTEMELVLIPDKRLTTKSEPVEQSELGASLRQTMKDMRELMRKHNGVGIAAPQVGINKRFFVVGTNFYVNPEVELRGAPQVSEEGCLSIPDFTAKIMRQSEVVVKATDPYGMPLKHYFKGAKAYAIQHELDHLDGLLINDHPKAVSPKEEEDDKEVIELNYEEIEQQIIDDYNETEKLNAELEAEAADNAE